jgi:hypothetical protein
MNGLDPELAAFLRFEHYQKYEALAQKLGIEKLKTAVMFALGLCCHADPVAYLREQLRLDRALNRIPLRQWDAQEPRVRALLRRAGGGVMSSCESVCVLKHVATHHVVGESAPEPAPDPRRKP